MSNPNIGKSGVGEATQFKEGNTASLQHGGAAAVKKIQRGEPMTGPARQAELGIYEQLENEGRVSLVRRGAARLEAAAECYWSAICKLMTVIEDKGQRADLLLPKLDGYIARFGWLQSSALRAWAQLGQEEKDGKSSLMADYEEMLEKARDDD